MLENFCGSEFWDSNLTWYTNNPDFTPCFEQTALVWSPLIFLLLFLPIDLYFTFTSKSKNIPWSWKNISKLIVNSLLLVICVLDFVFVLIKKNSNDVYLFDVFIYTPVIRFISLLICWILVILHKKYGQMSSGLLSTFWFVVAIVGIPQFRTDLYQYQNGHAELPLLNISYMVLYCLYVVMFLLQFLADDRPKETEYVIGKNACPESYSSFPSRLTYIWFDKMALLGYRRPLEVTDLWELNPTERSNLVTPQFDRYWDKTIKHSLSKPKDETGKKKDASVLGPLFKAYGLTFIAGAFMQLFQDLLNFISPQILKLLIAFVVDKSQPVWKGYIYVIVLVGAAMLQTLMSSQCNQKMFLVGLHVRTCLISAIYRKALRITSSSRKESTVGEIVNLMAVDAQRMMDVMTYINLIWSSPFQIALAIYFLWQTLGPSTLAGLGVMVLLIPINVFVASRMKTFQVSQMKNKDERVKMMNEILSGIKVLKLYAWETSFEKLIQKIRAKEIQVLKKSAYLNALISFLWACTPQLVSLATFAVFVLSDKNNILDARTAFVSLSLFNLLRLPLTVLPYVIMITIQTVVSMKRINKFMNLEELDPNNVTHNNEADPLVIERGTFSWDTDGEPTLKDINLRVKEGSLVAIVGAVGTGKSSLLSALLGEMDKISGKVNTKGTIAYVPQLAWIRNATLKDNIVFGKPLHEKKYYGIIDACALVTDIEILPAGDRTEIGEKGINLSGGQKQRVSLARAVYCNTDIYFLDDPLSAVDSHVGKHIFENVIGPTGILNKKTRLLVTHSITYLPHADVIVVLKDGTISEIGSYQELLDRKGAFSDFIVSHIQEAIESDEIEDMAEIKKQLIESDPELQKKLETQRSRLKSASSDTSSLKRKDSVISNESSKGNSKTPVKPKVGEVLIEEERAETGGVKLSVYLHYFKSVGPLVSITVLVLNFIYQGLSVGTNIWLSDWSSDREIYINGTLNTARRDMYLEGYGLFGLVQVFAVMALAAAIYLGALNAAESLHNYLLHTTLRVPTSFFDVTPLGRIMNRFSKDVDTLDNILPHTLRAAINCLFSVGGVIFVISYSTPIFLAVILPMLFIYYFIQKYYVATSRQLMRLESVTRSPIYSHFGESVTGMSSIRAFKLQQKFILESEEKVDLNQVCYFPSLIAARWLAVRLEMVGNLIVFFSSLFAVLGRDWISPGIVGLSVSYALQITDILNYAVQMAANVETNVVSVERIKEYTETEQEAAWEIQPSAINDEWPSNGQVEFRNFQVRYREGLDLVLKGITFTIKGGEKVGIVGRTGAGKSSLTLCLFRIIESSGGSILIDGIEIDKLGLHDLRSRLTIIPQDPILFSGSLRMNLDPFDKYSDDQVWKALELAHLKDFVKTLSAGLQHEVTEGGDNLSVGQRQLICLARALLRKTKVLILDEATAAVDLETDDLIQKTIRSEFANCTVLTIAHRINTIMDSDRVIVLDKGYLVEFDRPDKLLQLRDSIFYGMARDAGLV